MFDLSVDDSVGLDPEVGKAHDHAIPFGIVAGDVFVTVGKAWALAEIFEENLQHLSFPHDPDFFAWPAMRPFGGDVLVPDLHSFWGLEFDEIFDFEARLS